MINVRQLSSLALSIVCAGSIILRDAQAQERLPIDNSSDDVGSYHPAPAYRESESHPLRILAYIVHPIGWLAREVIFRPFSYFASSTSETRAIMGYRDPYDFRDPQCFSGADDIPDCRQIKPFDYAKLTGGADGSAKPVVYFPDVNFDFDKRSLNGAGKEKAQEVARLLKDGAFVKVELQGHADERGSDTYNMKLGTDRAAAVKAELVSLGIPEPYLSTVSFGERRPLRNEKTEEAFAANRRVEVHVSTDKK